MKWFKHDTDADNSEGLDALVEQFGFEGYGRWFRLLETIAKKMERGSDRCHVEYSESKWCQLLKVKRKQLGYFLKATQKQLKTKVEVNGNLIRIECPNLLKKRDEYSRKSGVSQDKVPNKSKEVRSKELKNNKDSSHPAKKPQGVTSENDLRLAEIMKIEIINFFPKFTGGHNLKSWVNDIRLMRGFLKVDHDEIQKVFDWAINDEFWAGNIQSPGKLRKHWDRLNIEMAKSQQPTNGNGRRPSLEHEARMDEIERKAMEAENAKQN